MVQHISLNNIDEYVEDHGYGLRQGVGGWEMFEYDLDEKQTYYKAVVSYPHKGVKFMQLCIHYIVMSEL